MSDRLKLVLDCDPGHDDALAIWLAAQHADVLGVTTVHGNQSLDKVTRNALQVMEVGGLDIPVYAGCSRPLVQDARHAPGIHGESGLDGPDLAEPKRGPESEHAVDFLIESAHATPGLIVVATGPLTNLAVALRRAPGLVDNIGEISLMGGSLTYGNISPTAEFNIWADPEAAHVVFGSGIPLRMVGLNLTRQAEAGPKEVERFRAVGTRLAHVAADLVEFYGAQVRRLFGLGGASLHDPCAVAWLLVDDLMTSRGLHVDVELNGALTRGMTVCDQRHVAGAAVSAGDETVGGGGEVNTRVGIDLDVDRFFDLMIDALAKYPDADGA